MNKCLPVMCLTKDSVETIAETLATYYNKREKIMWLIILENQSPKEKIETLKSYDTQFKNSTKRYETNWVGADSKLVVFTQMQELNFFLFAEEKAKGSQIFTATFVKCMLDFPKVYDHYLFLGKEVYSWTPKLFE